MIFIQKTTFKLFFGAFLALLGLGLTHAGIGIGGSGRSYGYITDFASIFVDGVEYSIAGANILINGQSNRPQSELKLGMAVRVEGTINPGGVTGTATVVEYLGDIVGTIDAAPVVNGMIGSFHIYGLAINADSNTRYTDGVTLAALNAGDAVEVSGLVNENDGSFTATRIEKQASLVKIDLRGYISSVTATTFVLGPSLVVDYSAAQRAGQLKDVPPGGFTNGLFVEVKATTPPANGTLTATRVNVESSVLASPDIPLGVVQGIAAKVTANGFAMGNQPIVINAQTVFDGAPPSALANNVRALASGPVVSGIMTAQAVTIAPALLAVQSRKTHGAAGPIFDLPVAANIDVSGAVTVESRVIGTGGHNIVFQFDRPVNTVGGVSAKDAGLINVGVATFAIAGNDVVVTLTGVPDNKRAKITLTSVNVTGNDATASVGFLVGDVNNTRSVNSSDISGVKARSGLPADSTNFRFDVNASGAINSADISSVKARSGLSLAP